MRALVIGAGVVGLTAAVRLLEGGWEVEVLARERGRATVSAVAGGLWLPYGVAADARELDWARRTYGVYEQEGVELVEYVELLPAGTPDPWWAAALPPGHFRRARPDELPDGYEDAVVATVPLVETPAYLVRLEERIRALGGAIRAGQAAALAAREGVVVNCAGLGAAALAGDGAVRPVRGQVVLVAPPPGARRRAIVDQHGPNAMAYVLPRRDAWVLGGVAVQDTWDVAADPAVTPGILARCAALLPELARAEPLAVLAGLRPARHPSVRLEAEGRVVHCYGHGGSGWTLAWACADDIVRLAEKAAMTSR